MFGFRKSKGEDATPAEIAASTLEADIALVRAWSPEERAEKEKKFLRRIDLRLLPILAVMYVLNYIDRNAVPHARVQGLEEDLGLVGFQYNIVLSVTFAGYISMQIPSNMILSFFRPSWYLSTCMVAWGICSGLSGIVHNFTGLAIARFFLGITEAPFFVGCAFLFSGWYTRKEVGLRLGIFFSAAMLSGAFGGLFAAGIAAAFKSEPAGLETWRWLFILEGIVTVICAVVTGFTIPDWPATTKWLSPEERALGVLRLIEDAGAEEEDTSAITALKLAVRDYRLWLCVLGQVCLQAVASLANFLPTLVKDFGFGTIETLLLTAPPYVLTTVACIGITWHSDRTGMRSFWIIVPCCVTICGIIITFATTNIGARYFAIFLMLPATYGCFQVSNAWMANIAARPQKKRAIALAMNTAFGNSAMIWTPYLYPASQGPNYYTAWSVNVSLMVVGICATLALRIILQRENRQLGRDELHPAIQADLKEGFEETQEIEVSQSGDVTVRHRFQI
ncbi:unnamed protein product [Clonostachys rosea f. rosea IK726]|uniref:Major facilitator superfamily (MFS) profile domain-containing protein n=2 Tax=Bionectria ochroleuca TaxID=29856 RepID=A0A0B7KNB5_BIOOC|nr:unnamed protein product [Clonostachys rosea f. rosea IK726]